MSYVKINENLFLEKQELNRLVSFLGDAKGSAKYLQLKNTWQFGIIRNVFDTNFTNFKVEAGSNPKTIKIAESIAVDSNLNLIYKEAEDNIAIPDNGNWYWVKIAHRYTPQEIGTVAVDTQGNLTGTGTKFTDVLRGQPNFPAKVKFYNSSTNFSEYEVVEVTSDTSAVLAGVFTTESNLRYSVIGNFTEDFVPPSSYKEIYQYDNCIPFTIGNGLVAEITNNTAPNKTANLEFYIARVRIANNILVIEDKRTEFFKEYFDYNNSVINKVLNPLIGVESVKWTAATSPRYENEINVGFGFVSSSWTIDSSLRKITISGGDGGRFKDTSRFTDGDFNGWKLYCSNGSFFKIISSWKTSSQINCTLDILNPDDFAVGSEIVVVPNVEQVEFRVTSNGGTTPIIHTQKTFDAALGKGKILVQVPDRSNISTVKVEYRYKLLNDYSSWTTIVDDTTVGYYAETSFLDSGAFKPNIGDRVLKTYTGGLIQLVYNPSGYANIIFKLDKGDIFEVNRQNLPVGGNFQLTVGAVKSYQYMEGAVSLTDDLYFSLNTTNAREGNKFTIHINCDTLNMNGKTINLHQDFSGAVNPTRLRKTLTQGDAYQMKNMDNGLVFECVFDGTNWIVSQNYDLGVPNEIIMLEGQISSMFDTTTNMGKVKGLFGYQIMTSFAGRSPIGQGTYTEVKGGNTYNNVVGVGSLGGEMMVELGVTNIPAHSHKTWAANTSNGGDLTVNGTPSPDQGLGGNPSYRIQQASPISTPATKGNSSSVGDGTPHNNVHPVYGVIFAKKLF